ncbi:MAG: AraC family transcriptional regulator [Clostridia bacterium]|nr:AraC family transcriptional regulator [Clostridia bacterium]
MDNQSYYRQNEPEGCNVACYDHYLVVNCAGISVLNKPFTTWRPAGRKDYYLMYLCRGGLTLYQKEDKIPFSPGQFVLIKPCYETRYCKEDYNTMIYYWAHFTGYGAPEFLSDCYLEDLILYEAGVCQPAIDTFHDLFNQFIYRDTYFQISSSTLMMQILVSLRRAADNRAQNKVTAERISRSLAYIHQHYSRPITVQDLADMEHLSVSRYSALFRVCMGLSPQSYIIDLRLRMATELLQRTDLTIKQVAHTVGYEDQLYFSRLFKARKGISPSSYQQQCHGVEATDPKSIRESS